MHKLDKQIKKHPNFDFGEAPFTVGDTELKEINYTVEGVFSYYYGEVIKGTTIRHGRGVLVNT